MTIINRKSGVFVGHGLFQDQIFKLESVNNRDSCYAPYILLKNILNKRGYKIHTPDMHSGEISFEFHMNVNLFNRCQNRYLMLLETEQIFPPNGVPKNWTSYKKIFTWDDTLVDGQRFIKLNLPNSLTLPTLDGIFNRDLFCVMIAGNKVAAQNDHRELYSERVKTIRWFENHARHDFHLYGTGWSMPAASQCWYKKIAFKIFKPIFIISNFHFFPSYKGIAETKMNVLKRARFSICYENVKDLSGYITEKIFDCFFAGCVPVYWGASNVSEYIPKECFIDRREFNDTESMYRYLKSVDSDQYLLYQQAILNFLTSDAAQRFSSTVFVETIVNTIVKDLEASS